jgi:hypothetical protein
MNITPRKILLGCGVLVIAAMMCATGIFIAPFYHTSLPQPNTNSSTDTATYAPSVSGNTPSGTTPIPNVTVQTQQQPSDPTIVNTTNQPCPDHDFSLENGMGSCSYSGGKLLICEGDMNFPTFGFQHDSIATTGQVFEIDQAGTIDGRDNGGTCHYSPPWTLAQSISSVKGGCGGGCATVLVYKDGQQIQTA